MIMKFSGMSTITSFSGIGFGSYMRFMTVARVAWASLEMDPKLMAPVNYWFNIFKMCNLTRKFTSHESLDNFGSRFDIFNANRLARRNDFQLASQSALAQAFHGGLSGILWTNITFVSKQNLKGTEIRCVPFLSGFSIGEDNKLEIRFDSLRHFLTDAIQLSGVDQRYVGVDRDVNNFRLNTTNFFD
jgi:hypothetical protein